MIIYDDINIVDFFPLLWSEMDTNNVNSDIVAYLVIYENKCRLPAKISKCNFHLKNRNKVINMSFQI